jgi:hypothetical protein
MFAIPTQVIKSNQWQLRSSLRQPMGVEPCCTWGCSNKNKASVSFRLTYTLDFNNSSFITSDSENYETTFNHFLLRFLRYLCNFCPNICSQEAILMKVSHLGVVTLKDFEDWKSLISVFLVFCITKVVERLLVGPILARWSALLSSADIKEPLSL